MTKGHAKEQLKGEGKDGAGASLVQCECTASHRLQLIRRASFSHYEATERAAGPLEGEE